MHSANPRPRSALRAILNNESSGGLVLMGAATLALVIANSPAADVYFGALHTYVLGLSVLHWINDALMAVFFLFVGLEIKREMLDGQLSTWSRRALPGIAALGGMVVPALIYLVFNLGGEGQPRGWAIPSATDIAFALGVLSLLGPRVPISLKVFLTALAIIDDLGAIVIIAVFYTSDLNIYALGGALFVLSMLRGLNAFGYADLKPYLALGVILWVLVFLSGIHATLAGVALALTIPLKVSPGRPEDTTSPLHQLEHALQPWVVFLIVPIFGLANAGVSFASMSLASLVQPVPTRRGVGSVRRQAGWRVELLVDRDQGRLGRPPGACDLVAALWGRSLVRDRFHHEPVHRSPGIPRLGSPSGRYKAWSSDRLWLLRGDGSCCSAIQVSRNRTPRQREWNCGADCRSEGEKR